MSLHGLLGNVTEVTFEEIEDVISAYLLSGEVVEKAYKTIRDLVVFTPYRVIKVNKQKLGGKKTEFYSVPWRNVISFSTENAGRLDLNEELKLYLRGSGYISIGFKKGSDIIAVQQYIARKVLIT